MIVLIILLLYLELYLELILVNTNKQWSGRRFCNYLVTKTKAECDAHMHLGNCGNLPPALLSDPLIKPHCISESDSMAAVYHSGHNEICDGLLLLRRDWHPENDLIASLWCNRSRSVHRSKGVVLCYKYR